MRSQWRQATSSSLNIINQCFHLVEQMISKLLVINYVQVWTLRQAVLYFTCLAETPVFLVGLVPCCVICLFLIWLFVLYFPACSTGNWSFMICVNVPDVLQLCVQFRLAIVSSLADRGRQTGMLSQAHRSVGSHKPAHRWAMSRWRSAVLIDSCPDVCPCSLCGFGHSLCF